MINKDYKSGKIIEIIREWDNTGNKYEINGIDKTLAVPFFRYEFEKFKVIPKGSYRFISENNNEYMEITNPDILANATQFQLVYIYSQESSKYIEDFPDINILKEKYNQLVEDTTNIFGYLKSVGLIADTEQMTQVLTQLRPMETWYMNAEGEIDSLPVSEFSEKLKEVIQKIYEDILSKITTDYEGLSKKLATQTQEELAILQAKFETLEGLLDTFTKLKLTEISEFTQKKIDEIQKVCDELIAITTHKLDKVDTIEQLKQATWVKLGDVVEVLGYYSKDDGATHKRVISDVNDGSGVELDNGLWANIVKSDVYHSSWFGTCKNGDVTELFKKMIAYNKPLIIDEFEYELKETLICDFEIIKNNNGTFKENYLVWTKKLNKDLPQKSLIGNFRYKELVGDVSHQSMCYNKNTGEYILGFSNKGSQLSKIAIIDKDFNFLRKKDIDLGHCNGMAFNPYSNKIIVGGYLGGEPNNSTLFILNYETLEIEERKVLGDYITEVSYDNKRNIYAVGNVDYFKLLDENFNVIKKVDVIDKNYYDGWTSQDGEFFNGNYIITFCTWEKFELISLNLRGEVENVYRYENQLGEPEGLTRLDDSTLLLSEQSDGVVYISKLDFERTSINQEDVVGKFRSVVYVDSSAAKEGDGTKLNPFKTINYALRQTKGRSISLILKGSFKENVTISSFSSVTVKRWLSERVVIDGQLKIGCDNGLIAGITFIGTHNQQLRLNGGRYWVENVHWEWDSSDWETGLACYRALPTLLKCSWKNVYNPIYVAESSNAFIMLSKFENSVIKFRVKGATVFSDTNTIVGVDKNEIVRGLGYIQEYPITKNVQSLNTPYHATKMRERGVYKDFIEYMDKELAFEKEQEKVRKVKEKQQKQLEEDYEEFISQEKNKDVTFEEFITQQAHSKTKMLKLAVIPLEEPKPSEKLQQFIDEFL